MTNLDLETLRFFSKIIVTISAIAILAFWRSSGLKKDTAYWVLGIVIYAIFPFLPFSSETSFIINPDFFVDLCIISSALLLFHGSRKVFNMPAMLLFSLTIGTVAIGTSYYIATTNVDPLYRIINSSAVNAIVFSCIAASLILQTKFPWRNSIFSITSVFLIYALYHAMTGIYVLTVENPNLNLLINILYCSTLFTLGITMALIHIGYKILQIESNVEKAASTLQIKDIENRWLLALEFSKAGHWEWNINTLETFYSSQWKKMLGYSDTDQFNDSLEELTSRFHPDDAKYVHENMEKFLNRQSGIYESIHRIKNKNGQWVWILSRARFIDPTSDNKPSNIVGIDIDISAQKKTEEALKDAINESHKAKVEAEIANNAKTFFLNSMSHELRTPMNAILGFSQLLEGDPEINSEQRDSLEIINNSGKHLLSLIDSILDWSRIESGETELLTDSFNPMQLFKEISLAFEAQKRTGQFEFYVNISPDLPQQVSSDPMRIRQICTNLLDNAFKFTDQGKVTFNVDYENIDEKNSNLRIQVIDTGFSIDKSKKETVFSIFGQTESPRSSNQVSGSGLFISKKLATLLGGSLELSSEIDETTCFILKIPVIVDLS